MPFLALFGIAAVDIAKDGKRLGFAVAKMLAFIAYILTGIGVLFTASYLLLDGVAATFPATGQMVWGWFMPPSAFGCLTTIVSIRILRAGYDFKIQLAKLKVQSVRP